MVKNTAAACTFLLLATAAQIGHAQFGGIKVGGIVGEIGKNVSDTAKQAGRDLSAEAKRNYQPMPGFNTERVNLRGTGPVHQMTPTERAAHEQRLRAESARIAAQQEADRQQRQRYQEQALKQQKQQLVVESITGIVGAFAQAAERRREEQALRLEAERVRQAQWTQPVQPYAPTYDPRVQNRYPQGFNGAPTPYPPQQVNPYQQPQVAPGYYQPMPAQSYPVQYRGW